MRRLLHENAVLKMDLQRRTVELGAVSSLLLEPRCFVGQVSGVALIWHRGGPQFGTGFKRLPFLCIFIMTELLIILFDPFSGIFKSNGTRLDGSP